MALLWLVCLLAPAAGASIPDVSISKVHVVYMTHLDIGYVKPTMLDIVQQWQDDLLKAVRVAEALPERFAWTVHAWMLQQVLNNYTGTLSTTEKERLRTGITKGHLSWHALPANLQSELVTEDPMFIAGLDVSKRLDIEFTLPLKIAGSQKDVPGITRGAVRLMREAGLKALHVGANDFSTVAALPPLGTKASDCTARDCVSPREYEDCMPFLWEGLMCFWCSGYGPQPFGKVPAMVVKLPGFSEALSFVMRVDDSGPPDVAEVTVAWAAVQGRFPQAHVVLSTLDAFARAALANGADARLPVFEGEMGDTWIHGVASDPFKMAAYRALSRVRTSEERAGRWAWDDARTARFDLALVKLVEHTWGFNQGILDNDQNWSVFDPHNVNIQVNEKSFLDQRKPLHEAVTSLGTHPSRVHMEAALTLLAFRRPLPVAGWVSLPAGGGPLICHGATWGVGPFGEITVGTDKLVAFHYKTHSGKHMDDYSHRYLLPRCWMCGGCGFAKCNMTGEDADWKVNLAQAYSAPDGCSAVLELRPVPAAVAIGAPRSVYLNVSMAALGKVELALQWQDKAPTRMAESLWLSFGPDVSGPWTLEKTGGVHVVAPDGVAVNGSRNHHAVRSVQAPSGLNVTSHEVPLVVLGAAEPLPFMIDSAGSGAHFNLFNNMWSTNYPAWSLDRNQGPMRFSVLLPRDPLVVV